MDEPTSVLTPQEVERLFDTLRKLATEGVSILYISHKLEEIRQLCDRATILRGGRVVALCDPRAETARSMAQMMIGAELKTVTRRSAPEARGGSHRSEEHTSELQSLMRISYAVFCLKKTKQQTTTIVSH